jgi:hypothetical protein
MKKARRLSAIIYIEFLKKNHENPQSPRLSASQAADRKDESHL